MSRPSLRASRRRGFEDRQNIRVEYRWAEGEYERVPALVAELLALKPKMVVAYGPPNLPRAAIDAIPRDMPLVFGTGGDPVASGIVASLARPGGNATGVANRTNTLDIKRLELLRDLAPQATTIGMILNPKNSDAEEVTKSAQEGQRRSTASWSSSAPACRNSSTRHLLPSSSRAPGRF